MSPRWALFMFFDPRYVPSVMFCGSDAYISEGAIGLLCCKAVVANLPSPFWWGRGDLARVIDQSFRRFFMKTLRFALGSLLLVAFLATASMAQNGRTFVSGAGSDTNPCSLTSPCRTFTQAISKTNAGGEVIVLDSAGYGAFTINQAVSITAPPGVYAGISVGSLDGIDVNAPSATVILRGLTINNQGSSPTGVGIGFNTGHGSGGGTLRIEGCVVNGFNNGPGIDFTGPGTLEVKDSILTGNNVGISVTSVSGTARAAIDNVRLEDNTTYGITVYDGTIVTVRNSAASGNQYGFAVNGGSSAAGAQLNLEKCVATNNITYGVDVQWNSSQTGAAEINIESCVVSGQNATASSVAIGAFANSTAPATVRLSNSMVTDNTTGLQALGATATILSRGNNTVEGNNTYENTSGGGTITTYTAK
jgi:hypothetical protein